MRFYDTPGIRGCYFVRGEHVGRTAEFAGYGDLAVLDHVVAVFLRETLQHGLDALARARALRVHRRGSEHADTAFVEETVGQSLARQRRIDQFDVVNGSNQRTALDPGVVLGRQMRLGAGRRIARIEISLARALRRLG